MTIGEQFEAHFREVFHIAGIRVHHQQAFVYREPQLPKNRRPLLAKEKILPPRPNTLRFYVAKRLQSAPDGLTVAELRDGCDAKSNVLSGMLWSMTNTFREIEPAGHRKVGPKTCRVYRWIGK